MWALLQDFIYQQKCPKVVEDCRALTCHHGLRGMATTDQVPSLLAISRQRWRIPWRFTSHCMTYEVWRALASHCCTISALDAWGTKICGITAESDSSLMVNPAQQFLSTMDNDENSQESQPLPGCSPSNSTGMAYPTSNPEGLSTFVIVEAIQWVPDSLGLWNSQVWFPCTCHRLGIIETQDLTHLRWSRLAMVHLTWDALPPLEPEARFTTAPPDST